MVILLTMILITGIALVVMTILALEVNPEIIIIETGIMKIISHIRILLISHLLLIIEVLIALYKIRLRYTFLPLTIKKHCLITHLLEHKLYQAIIDSSTSISMIFHKTVKELGLTIEKTFNSFIVPAVETSTQPLGIIKDLLVEIDHVTIPLTVEVVDTTSYSVLLSNNWNQKVEANYNKKNSCHTFK
ncbi:gag-pol fusion protein [Gigaspora margarita]|uniref:Gag-pol fusion protein n=1 Tax=Gigaspora margarita TaxID=4874 RepID=A0A8H4B3F0_GIGMA|nr:gag-pol fusion protein [Gigaspora margarita]